MSKNLANRKPFINLTHQLFVILSDVAIHAAHSLILFYLPFDSD